MEKKSISEHFEEIIKWAELQDFADAKLRTLSTGMKTRLAFSITRYIESDIFLVDEALSAGDRSFKEKCEKVFENHTKTDRTLIFSSHNMGFIRRFATKTIWLHQGKQMAFDDTEIVLKQYGDFQSG